MTWLAEIAAPLVILLFVIGMFINFLGFVLERDRVIIVGASMWIVPVLLFIITFCVLTLIHVIFGVDFGYPIN